MAWSHIASFTQVKCRALLTPAMLHVRPVLDAHTDGQAGQSTHVRVHMQKHHTDDQTGTRAASIQALLLGRTEFSSMT